MNNKKKGNGLFCLIAVFFVIFIGILGVLSLFIHCDTNIYAYGHPKTITQHTPYVYAGMTIAGIGIIIFLCRLLECRFLCKEQEKVSNIIFWVCGGVIFLGGIVWIIFNDGAPISDQISVYREAQKIAGFLQEPFDQEYFALFHRNRGITLFVAAAMKIFGNNLYSFRIFNLAALIVIYFSICSTVGLVFENKIVRSITAVLLVTFYPLIIYTGYIYGTLMSAACTSFGLYAAVALSKTKKIRYGIYIIFVFPFGIAMHQSAAIGLVAVGVYFILQSRGKLLIRNILICILTVFMIVVSTTVTDTVYTRITGTDPNAAAIPASCTIYMGLTSTEESGGPGSQDRSYAKIFMDNNRDSSAANRDAIGRIGVVMKEYLTGKRSLMFFLEKMEYQWLDPSFGARKIINLNDPNEWDTPNSDLFIDFYNSSFRKIIYKAAISLMILIYAGSLITGIKSIRSGGEYPAMLLFQLYVIGGGIFQMFWESLSRYCFCYFLWLIPTAAFGIYSLYRFIEVKYKSWHGHME